ncbi:lasso peptide biosynthesis B2 protein [Sphingomonas sp. HITSZ_GF]|uniref:lasso peptide biosynthesis B2 protein n=1 Tax=Sphingomonas sp. HITSZ_GF TaxID=3037247 RepID=UPI00240D901F|nr:lasso peptide biosynthesis B2 protein [Sphingomonas sp. HITSZ_GF]MDG2535243.1 lasso peptide biosynthesis B2 protein [Sphingomonas sp. HITSZ_GF]
MSHILRPGLSWCLCADRAVFLDLTSNRYFCLPEMADTLFRRWAAGEILAPDALAPLLDCGVIVAGKGSRSAATMHPAATRDFGLDNVRGAAATDVMAAIAGQLQARWWLKLRPMASIAARLVRERTATGGRAPDEARQRQVAGAFVTSATLLRAADQCLPRAIAARRLCQRHGQEGALVFGVRLEPFAAHSWVQCGDAVIVGELENVRLYTPILVLP